jgi:membrane protein
MNFRKIKEKILNFWPIAVTRAAFKRLILPGFDGMSLYEVSSFFFRGITQGSISTRAAALSFTFFLALFPAIIFIFTLIPYIPIHGLQNTLLSTLQNLMPKGVYEVARTTITDIINRQHGSLLSIGFLAALFFSTNGITGIMTAFNASVHVEETRSFLRQKAIAILLVLIVAVLLVISISLITAGSSFIHYLLKAGIVHRTFSFYALLVCRWIIIIALFFFTNSFLYYLAPATHERFRFISAGSTLATFLFVVTSIGFNYYISHFSQYNKLYGSIGALIIILLWININSIVLLIGFELNASIMKTRQSKTKS